MTTQITSSFDNRMVKANGFLPGTITPRPPIASEASQAGTSSVSPELLQNAVAEANKVLSQTRSDLKLDIDSESKEVVIKIIEPGSGEVINQYPSKASLAITNAITELQQKTLDRRAAYQSDSAMSGLIIKQKS